MPIPQPLARVRALSPYVPGLSIAEIRERYSLDNVIKLASNENPLGASPLAQEAVNRFASSIFRYPQGGNPRLAKALAQRHDVGSDRIVLGNGSDEIIDLLIRMLAEPAVHNIACFNPCFSIYPIQAGIAGVEVRRQPLESDFSFNFTALLDLVDENTRLVFITTPDNPSGYCPPLEAVKGLASQIARKAPEALLVVDEAYMDFAPGEKNYSLLANNILPDNTAFLRTFSKSYGLAGLRVGYGVLPPDLADSFWRARLPFSLNILAEEAALAALEDTFFREATLNAVAEGRARLEHGLKANGCKVWPSAANFIMFSLPQDFPKPEEFMDALLRKGIIIRSLASYGLPGNFRVSIGNANENRAFLSALTDIRHAYGDA